jgi:hypothetical protein
LASFIFFHKYTTEVEVLAGPYDLKNSFGFYFDNCIPVDGTSREIRLAAIWLTGMNFDNWSYAAVGFVAVAFVSANSENGYYWFMEGTSEDVPCLGTWCRLNLGMVKKTQSSGSG